MKDKVCLVTGSNSGVGKTIALGLARLGATVVMLCRDKNRGEQALAEIKEHSGNKNVDLMIADLSIQDSIRRFVAEFKNKYNMLHVLSNNAGIVLFDRQVTADGIEKIFATDYLSHFLLTHLLLDILKASSPSRIITVSGGPPWLLRKVKINFDDIQYKKNFNCIKAVMQAVLARAIFTFELAGRLKGTGVTANAFHPGLVRSDLAKNLPWYIRFLSSIIQPFLSKDCKTGLYLASSSKVENISGKFFVNMKKNDFIPGSYDESIAKRLWKISEELTGIQSNFDPYSTGSL